MDTLSMSLKKHYVVALLECDVTGNRQKIKKARSVKNISFNAWLIKVMSDVIQKHELVASYIKSKHKTIIFNDVNMTVLVEKKVGNTAVPLPLLIRQTNQKTAEEITQIIKNATKEEVSEDSVVIHEKPSFIERVYFLLPGFLRRIMWKMILRWPRYLYNKMGNVGFTALGMMGTIKGWFIHKAVHPLSIGVGSIVKKPLVVKDRVRARDVLHLTLLIDHDVVDGAPMARFVKELCENIESGEGL